jgi:hypothetical protein
MTSGPYHCFPFRNDDFCIMGESRSHISFEETDSGDTQEVASSKVQKSIHAVEDYSFRVLSAIHSNVLTFLGRRERTNAILWKSSCFATRRRRDRWQNPTSEMQVLRMLVVQCFMSGKKQRVAFPIHNCSERAWPRSLKQGLEDYFRDQSRQNVVVLIIQCSEGSVESFQHLRISV